MTSTTRPPVVPGYRIGELIGRGSSGTVWAACPEGADRDLAVKVVPVACEDEGAALTVELSALAAAGSRGDAHLARTHEIVAVAQPQRAVAIVMDRLRGGTLARLVATRGHLTAGEVVTVLTPVALTLARLHEEAMVHGDLAPSNVGFDALGRPVVLDLGVSRVIGVPCDEVYGTPGFVAPEVVAGDPVSLASDIYAIGALGWFALVGEPPPIPGERPALGELRPDVPDDLARAIERALHADPSARGEGRELAAAVYAAAPAAAIIPGDGDDPATMLTHRVRQLARGQSPQEGAPVGDGARRVRRDVLRQRSREAHLRAASMVTAAVVVLLVGAAAAALGRSGDPAGPPVAPDTVTATAVEQPAAAPSPAPRPTPAAQVLAAVVDGRARAWTSGDVAALSAVFAPGSPVLTQDESLLAEAVRAGHRYEGLAFAVSDVRPLIESEDRLRVEATITTSAYVVHTHPSAAEPGGRAPEGDIPGEAGSGRAGGSGGRPGGVVSVVEREQSEARVVVTLSRLPQGWRIAELEPAPTAAAASTG